MCPTKVKNHDLPPGRIFTFNYHGQIGYKVTHLVTSNSHLCPTPLDTNLLTSLSLLDSDKHSLFKRMKFFSLLQHFSHKQIVRTIKALIFCRDLNSFNHTHKVLCFLSLKAHKILQNRKPISLNFVPPKTRCFLFLNNFKQTEFKQEKETSKKRIKSFQNILCVHSFDF